MRTHVLLLSALCTAVLCCPARADFQPGVKVEADGNAIDIRIGHLVPCVMDWNADGKKDLVVGQFSGGKIRLYLNHGTDKSPVFKDYSFLHAGGKVISLAAG
jgi:hypothetical protein